MAHDAADRRTADSSGGTAAGENAAGNAADSSADCGVMLLRRHAATTAKYERGDNRTD